MDYLRGYRVMREDPEWIGKLSVACLLVLASGCIPVIPQLMLYGWQALMLRRAVSGQLSPMPRLDLDFNYLMKLLHVGFKAFLARMLWSLPVVAVAIVFACCIYASAIGAAFASVESEGGEGALLSGVGSICLLGGGLVFYLVAVVLLSMPMQIAVTRAELTDDLQTAMRFKDVMAMTKLLFRELLFGNLVMLGLGMLVGIIGLCTLYIGLFPGIFVLILITTHWQAQLYQRYLDKGGVPLKVGPLDVEADPQPRQPAAPTF